MAKPNEVKAITQTLQWALYLYQHDEKFANAAADENNVMQR